MHGMTAMTMPSYSVLASDPRSIAESVRSAIEEARSEAESTRRLPAPLLAVLRAAGAFRLLTPQELGGFEADLPTMLQALEAFARIDGSVAWNVWNGNIGFSAALFEPPGISAVWGDGPDPVIANSARPTGTAVATDGGFTLSGRWDIVSAIDSADWVALFGIVLDAGGPRIVASGMPDIRVFFLRKDQITVLDTWQVNGMRGTGSNSVVVEGQFVAEYLAPSPFAPTMIDRPLYRVPAFTLAACGSAAVVLGMAQSSIDEVLAMADSKATGNGQTLRHREHAHTAVAIADAKLRGARLHLHATAADIMATAKEGSPIPDQLRGALRAAMSHAGRTSREVVTEMYELGSSSSLYLGNRLEQIFRDTNAAAQHALLQPTHFETAGRLMMGLEPGVAVF